MTRLNEETLVQETTADYLRDNLGWESVFAYNDEDFGPNSLLGRNSDKEVVLARYLKQALMNFNPGLPEKAYSEAIRVITEYSSSQSLAQINKEKYELLKDGVLVEFRNEKNELIKQKLRVFDFNEPTNNHFLCVREFWIRGFLYRKRADIVGFVNGIPLLFMEVKNINKSLKRAYDENFCSYKNEKTIPHLFHHNAFVVIGNGEDALVGSLTSKFEHFHEWKRLAEEDPGVVDMETLLKGICNKHNFMDIFENFILFDESMGKVAKIVARNHQYIGVNRALDSVVHRKEKEGKLGVFWHTQGSGKSYSIVFFTKKVHRKLGGNYTFLICTDRDDLDGQIYKTFAGCGVVSDDPEKHRASSGEDLSQKLGEHRDYIFTMIHKFNKDVAPSKPYNDRDDIIVITDEAHRTQYGRLSLNMRNALPNASYIGFTGTPLFKDDEITKKVFGDYVSTYDFQRAVEDKATVPLYYDARGEKLNVTTDDVNEKIAQKLEELDFEDIDTSQRLEKELKREYHIITANKRLDEIARDFVNHYSEQWESGKAMFVCIDKITCVRMYNLIEHYWTEKIKELEKGIRSITDEQEAIKQESKIKWMKETLYAVIISEEQGEVEKFEKWDLDIIPHRKLIKEGFTTPDGKRIDIETAYKNSEHPFRVAIVCAMWLTGFDVKSLATLYLDKPLKAHTLMQAIARANRINEGKNNGLIVDYCGILKNLRKALATFGGGNGPIDGGDPGTPPEIDPIRPPEELIAELEETIVAVELYLKDNGFELKTIIDSTGFERNAAIVKAKEAINKNDETRKRFEIMAREVFKKFKSCITFREVNNYRKRYDAIDIIYKKLQDDVDKVDISDIIRELHTVVDEAIDTRMSADSIDDNIYDISQIDFDLLRKEFEKCTRKNTVVQSLKDVIEKKLNRMVIENPLRADFQRHYEQIVSEYNSEKDRVTIERTFEALMKYSKSLDEEEKRAVKEGLKDQQALAMFDLLIKPELTKSDIEKLKKVANELLEIIKAEIQKIDNFREKQTTRDKLKVLIKDFLWDENKGLPECYSQDEIEEKANEVFAYVYNSEAA